MAGRFGVAQLSGVTTGTAVKTMIQLVAAANHAIRITEIGIAFHGTNNTHNPITVTLSRQTDAGTTTALTPVKADDSNGDTLDTTARHTATVEPTTTDVLRTWAVHPQTGLIDPLSDRAPIIVGAGDRVGLITDADNAVNADSYMAFEE